MARMLSLSAELKLHSVRVEGTELLDALVTSVFLLDPLLGGLRGDRRMQDLVLALERGALRPPLEMERTGAATSRPDPDRANYDDCFRLGRRNDQSTHWIVGCRRSNAMPFHDRRSPPTAHGRTARSRYFF